MPFIGDLDPAGAIAPTDQIPLDQTNADGTTDTRRAPAALFAEWLIGQVTASIGAPATAYTDAALVTAKAYTDQVGASVASTANGHADAVLASAKSYADGVGGTAAAATSAALVAAKAYADTAIADKATPISSLGPVSTVGADDMVGISQGGADHAIRVEDFLDGQTIDAGTLAAAAADTDRVWVGQGSSTMTAQTFSAIWTWMKAKLPGYRRPVVEIAANITLDGSLHNDAILVCSQPVTLTPAFVNMGSGFACSVINVSGGAVTFAAGVVTSSGAQTLATGLGAELRAVSYSGGTLVFASLAGSGAPLTPPGQVTGLTAGVATSGSVALSWQVPVTGGPASGFLVNYRVTSVGGAWTSQSTVSNSLTVSGLAPSTQYDFEVLASNAAGTGPASTIVTGSTVALPTLVPGQVTGLVASGPTASSVSLAWTAPATGGAVATYTVQFRITGAGSWTTAATGVVVTTYLVTSLTAATAYDFQVLAVNVVGNGTGSATANATTLLAVPGLPTALAAGAATGTTMPLTWTAPASGGAVATYTARWSPAGTNTWTVVAGIVGASTTITGLSLSTSYDFEVSAVNAGGSSAWTAAVTAATTSGGNYLLTAGFAPTAGTTWQVNLGGIIVNTNDNSVAGDGSHTVPASVSHAFSLSNSVVPTTGFQGVASQFSNGGHNWWGTYMTAPATPGNYYIWAVAKDAGANVVATLCLPTAFTVTA
ncbi:MAG: fibronectin type III domain-containing protein [Acetobacteraceae bacterium]